MVVAVAQASFLACKSPTQPLLAVAFAAIANLLGDVLLVVGLGWGIAGAAWATVAAQVTMGVALLYLLLKEGKRSKKIESTDAVTDGQGPPALRALPSKIPTLAQTMRFVKIAGPVCFLNTIKIVYVAVIVQAVTAISPECSAANGVMSAIYFFFAVMGDGVAQAAQSFLPPHLGSNQAVKVSVLLLVSAACLGLFNGLLSWFIAVGVPGIFTNSAEVTSIMKQSAPVMSFALMLHTASMGSEGCLLAARDMKFMTACYLPNSLLAYATLAACLAAMGHGGGPCAAFFSVLESMGVVGRMFGLVGELAANILNYFGIVGGAAGAAAMWASMAHFNFMRLAFNVVRMFVPGVGGKKGSPLLRTFVAEG
jgi:Na+-driven multidrug efflux pump